MNWEYQPKTSSGLEEVNKNVAQATTAAEQIAKDIAMVDQASATTTGNSEQVTESASVLNELAQKLSGLTGQFKLSTGSEVNQSE